MEETHQVRVEGQYALERKGAESRVRVPCGPTVGGLHVAERARRRAKALGWFSIAQGLVELFACRAMARLIGSRGDRQTRMALLGVALREIATGVCILESARPAPFVWARLAGDVIDLALLGKLASSRSVEPRRLVAAAAVHAGLGIVDAWTALQLDNQSRLGERGIVARAAITVNRPRDEVYRFWRDFENLPRFMSHLEAVKVSGTSSRWRAKASGGMRVEWSADVVVDRQNEMIAWRSRHGADIPNEGAVRFLPAPGGRGTEVSVELEYDPPGGIVAAAIARLFGKDPALKMQQDLRRFKQVLETGEVVHSDASIHHGPHPARPSLPFELSERQAAQ